MNSNGNTDGAVVTNENQLNRQPVVQSSNTQEEDCCCCSFCSCGDTVSKNEAGRGDRKNKGTNHDFPLDSVHHHDGWNSGWGGGDSGGEGGGDCGGGGDSGGGGGGDCGGGGGGDCGGGGGGGCD
ncbi:unnamed protein product [Allacma fusca]|uniref:Uncharacterized protein n=1 Tax=Allacma fusca TaxID=39272 RepID=A0A8J2PGN0_9HEXA|nr:unnamed protein product [Allacma fusca]